MPYTGIIHLGPTQASVDTGVQILQNTISQLLLKTPGSEFELQGGLLALLVLLLLLVILVVVVVLLLDVVLVVLVGLGDPCWASRLPCPAFAALAEYARHLGDARGAIGRVWHCSAGCPLSIAH